MKELLNKTTGDDLTKLCYDETIDAYNSRYVTYVVDVSQRNKALVKRYCAQMKTILSNSVKTPPAWQKPVNGG